MTTENSVRSELASFIAKAEAGKSVYISRVRQFFDSLNPELNGYDTHMVLEFAGNLPALSFPMRLPRLGGLSSEELSFVREYACASIYNILSTFGGQSLAFCYPTGAHDLDKLIDDVIVEFHPDSAKRDRKGYGRCLNVAERVADALNGLDPGSSQFSFQKNMPTIHLEEIGGWKEAVSSEVKTLKELPDRLVGKAILGMDIGGSDIKAILSVDGRIVSYKEYDWFPASFTECHQLVDPVLLVARWARARLTVERLTVADEALRGLRDALDDSVSSSDASDEYLKAIVQDAEKILEEISIPLEGLDSIGLCFPDVVVRNKIVGGEVYKTRGIRNNPEIDYEKDFRVLTDLDIKLAEYCRAGDGKIVVKNINDGPMAAFTSAVERAFSGDTDVNRGVFAHTLGTELGTGWLDSAAKMPEIPLEVYNYVIDLGCRPERQYHPDDPRSLSNFNTGIPGTLQKYTSQSGVFRLAMKYFSESRPDLLAELYQKGFLETDAESEVRVSEQPQDMRKPLLEHLMRLPEREGSDGVCGDIFRKIGEYLAVTWDETRRVLQPRTKNRILFGRLVKNPICFRLIQEGAARLSSDLQLIVADDESAWTPLMKQLRDEGRYTVAQFAQAVGAVHFAAL